MIIDAHVHTFPDKIAERAVEKLAKVSDIIPNTNGTVVGLKESMDKYGVDVSIVLPVATKPEQSENINRFAAKTNGSLGHTGILSLGGIHPDNENYKEVLNEAYSLGLCGIKLHPDYQYTDFNDMRYMRIIDYAASLNLVVVVHAGVDIGLIKTSHKIFCTPDMIAEVLDNIDYGRIVFAHMGGWTLWDEVEEKIAGRNCYMDTAFCFENQPGIPRISDGQFLRMCRAHGVEKILFATDSPWGNPGDMVKKIKWTGLTEDEQRLVFAENARKLFDI